MLESSLLVWHQHHGSADEVGGIPRGCMSLLAQVRVAASDGDLHVASSTPRYVASHAPWARILTKVLVVLTM
jgi:hypothetical protein